MNESNANLRSILNHLIQTCKDGQEGFLTAAENTVDPDIKHLFNEYSLQRAKFAGELQSLAHELGEHNPKDAGSVAGTIHRRWINLKTAVAGKDRLGILTECEQGEDGAVAHYQDVLKHELPANIREFVERQYGQVQGTHSHVKALRDNAKS